MLYNVWHVAGNGDVYPIQKAIAKSKAVDIADTLQDMSFAKMMPEGFYMISSIGKDIDWIEAMEHNQAQPEVDYMGEYQKFQANPVQIERQDYGRR